MQGGNTGDSITGRFGVRWLCRAYLTAALALAPQVAWGFDGGGSAPPPPGGGGGESGGGGGGGQQASAPPTTYYEDVLGGASAQAFASAEPGLPSELHVVQGSATVEYRVVDDDGETTTWDVVLKGFNRPHERVDAVYDLILALPLPADAAGAGAFQAQGRGIVLREGSEASSVPFIYGGEKLVLKRNVGLEKSLLPALLSGGSEAGKLPALADTGYRYTLWDAIVLYDASHDDSVQGWARLRYETDSYASAPDAGDARLAAYAIAWIPSLPAGVPPFAVRIDVVDPED